MDHFHKSTGVITYDPPRGDMKNRINWWCVVNVDKEITRYYRWWLQKEKHIYLDLPAWNAHISVIKGESACSKRPELWKKYQGKRVDFLYEHGNIRCEVDKKNGGHYYWIDVECPLLNQIREELGLPSGWKFHITIGRTHY